MIVVATGAHIYLERAIENYLKGDKIGKHKYIISIKNKNN